MSKPKRLTGSAESILVGSCLGLSVCVLGSKRRGGCCLSLPKERILATQDLLHLQPCSATTRLPTGANLFREEGGRTWGRVKVDKLHLRDVIKCSGFTHALPQLETPPPSLFSWNPVYSCLSQSNVSWVFITQHQKYPELIQPHTLLWKDDFLRLLNTEMPSAQISPPAKVADLRVSRFIHHFTEKRELG